MIISFFENDNYSDLYPLSWTRPVADIRVGILTIAEKWAHDLDANSFGFETRDYLNVKYPCAVSPSIRIQGNIIPNKKIIEGILTAPENSTIKVQNNIVAIKGNGIDSVELDSELITISRPFHIFKYTGIEINADFKRITQNRSTQTLSRTNTVIGDHPVFLEEGATAECVVFNTSEGPVYIGKNAQIMEGSIIRGPFAMGEGSNIKMGSKIYGSTSLGPYCNIGGEVNNVSVQGFSNKGHDGFLGNAVLGEWCNIGADTNCSNLKNTYDEVKVWNYSSQRFEKSGEQFCGLIMGDHSKCGINTMFNTGTVVGVACNLFGAGFPRQFVPDFSWGGATGFITHKMPAVEKTAKLMMIRRKKEFNEGEKEIIHAVFDKTKELRTWERDD
ncbi:MAG: putative sugar nucleotidyl transferase [Bacteroidia bacterium]